MAESKIPLIAIVGPTASGKTSLAVAVCKALGGEAVSCDSMQIYKGMDIATAKPTHEEMQGIPHHLIGFAEPDEVFSVAKYCESAKEIIEDIYSRDKKAVLVSQNRKDIVEEIAGKTNLSLLDYANLVIETNHKGENPKEKDGIIYYTYKDNAGYTYLATVHKSENAFWLVQFVCQTAEYDDMKDTFFSYAKSVSINKKS